MKEADDAGYGRELARLLDLPDAEDDEDRDGFRHRVLGLALEAYRRELISRGKLSELAALLSMAQGELRQLVVQAGLDECEAGCSPSS